MIFSIYSRSLWVMEIKFVAIFKVKLAKSLHIRGSIEDKVSSMLVTSNALN
jgi:hypothetical protein